MLILPPEAGQVVTKPAYRQTGIGFKEAGKTITQANEALGYAHFYYYCIFTLMKLLLISITVITFVACKKSTDSYPSCFTNEVSSINISTSCFSLTTIAHINSGKTVTIELNDSALNLSPTCSTYNILEYPGDVVVKYYTYTYHPDSGYVELCTDAFYPRHRLGQKTTWSAVSGSVTAVVSKAAKDRQPRENYKMSMRLDNVKFVSANADTTISLVLKDKIVHSHIP